MMNRRDWDYLLHILLILAFTVATCIMLGVLERRVGGWANTTAGLVALAIFLLYLRWLWRTFDRWLEEDLTHLRAHCTGLYRVLGRPANTRDFYIPNGVKVCKGDYAWEAPPFRNDGLIYLEGLTEDWGLLWKAGFHPADVERVCEKPVSQYDWRDFEYPGLRPGYGHQWKECKPVKPCPYPVSAPEGVQLCFPSPY